MTAPTPAEIAAAAARVATEWTPERVAAMRSVMVYDPWADELESQCPDLALAADAIEALLADRERLRGLVAERHSLRDHRDENNYLVSWSCSCGKWRASGPEATRFYPLPHLDEPQARVELAAHVAAVLDGVSE